jgi:hypothetical protein
MPWVGLSALAQPRLTKGGQPYQGSYVVTRSRPYPIHLGQHAVLPLPRCRGMIFLTANRYPLTANTPTTPTPEYD